MNTQRLIYGLWTLVELFVFFSVTASYEHFGYPDDPSIVYTYSQFAEIEKQCSPFLSSASELKPDDSRGYRLKSELSFSNGDWEQEIGEAPLIPYDDIDMLRDNLSLISPLKLVSFEVTDVSSVHQLKNTVSLSGSMTIGISRNSSFVHGWGLKFYSSPGMSALTIVFQGIYIETEENGGERLMCLLGNSTLPLWKSFADPPDWEDSYGSNFNHGPPLLQDGQILLLLRYPRLFNLTKRSIRGEMRSLNEKGSFRYFDQVYISSQLGYYSNYQFSSEMLGLRTCDPYLNRIELMEDGINRFSGSEFCRILQHISGETFNVAPDWNFNGRYKYNSKLGPFLLGKEIEAIDWSYDNFRVIMQHVKCEQETTQDYTDAAKVSMVLRAIPLPLDLLLEASRTGLSGMTLAAEGLWNSSSGKLCMVGCLGVVDSRLDGCDYQISLYFTRVFSIKQRSIIFGSISSIKNETDSYVPLLFDVILRPEKIYRWYSISYLSYNYSNINLASAFMERSHPSTFKTIIKKSLLRYPALENREDLFALLDLLSSDLRVDAYANPDPLSDGHRERLFIRMEVLSLGPLVGQYSPQLHKNSLNETLARAKEELKKFQLLNVSMHLMFTEAPHLFTETAYRNVSGLFLEGLYDTLVGEMYLIGCRKVMVGSTGTERGRDCLLEVKVEYPSETARWLINPTVKITITSQRNEDDPLYFSPISLETIMIRYRNHEQDMIFRKKFEGILRIVMLLVVIAIILSQIIYINKRIDAIPYLSLVMLALQVLGYSLPLISDMEILFKSKESDSYRTRPYDLCRFQLLLEVLDYTGKLLVLSSLLLTARLFQKVLESRNRTRAPGPSKPRCVPSDKLVLLITLAIHIFAFQILFVVHGRQLESEKYTHTVEDGLMLRIWMTKFEDYIGLVQDFFLLPQIIGNFLWQNHVKPLNKAYYIGFTLVRLLLHFYDSLRDPILHPYVEKIEFGSLNPAFFPKFSNIAVGITMIMPAMIIYIQQTWNQKLSESLSSMKFKILPSKSKLYKKLLLKPL